MPRVISICKENVYPHGPHSADILPSTCLTQLTMVDLDCGLTFRVVCIYEFPLIDGVAQLVTFSVNLTWDFTSFSICRFILWNYSWKGCNCLSNWIDPDDPTWYNFAAVQGWALTGGLDLSRRPDDKSVLLFTRVVPFVSKFACISLSSTDKMRILDFPEDITQVICSYVAMKLLNTSPRQSIAV